MASPCLKIRLLPEDCWLAGSGRAAVCGAAGIEGAVTIGFLGAAGAGILTLGGGGGAFEILTGALGRAFGVGANFRAGFDDLSFGLEGAAFKAAILGARERGFLEARRFLEAAPGFIKVTRGKS